MKDKNVTEILPGIELAGLTLYLKKYDALVFGDLHLGFEEELNKLGFLVPRFQYREITGHMEKVFSRIRKSGKIGRAVINGDLKHEFGRISGQEWREVLDFLDFLGENFNEVILIKGNHDTIIGPIAGKKSVTIVDEYFSEDGRICVTHGHRIPRNRKFRESKTVIIAHKHPALALRDGIRTEKVKCFLKGRWDGKNLIQIPSLNFVAEGSDLLQDETLSPFMRENRGNFEVYCVEGMELLYFGRLKNLSGE